MTHTPSSTPAIPGLSDLTMLAVGGYATVFRAVQDYVGREVAVKVENRTLESEADQARFVREARAAGRMSSHPHVVDLINAGVTEDNHPYLVMELCTGSYQDRLPLGAAEVRTVGIKIAEALADSHERGVVHRDVKPANILISHFGEPALADFGLAILEELRDPHVALEVMTPAYAPPEAFRRAEPAASGDVYALCATLYAMLCGAPPRWQPEQPPGLLALIELFAEPVPSLPGVPDGLIEALRAGLANDPDHRPSARRFSELLTSLGPDGSAPGSPGAGLTAPEPTLREQALRDEIARDAAGRRLADQPTMPVQRRSLPSRLIDRIFGGS